MLCFFSKRSNRLSKFTIFSTPGGMDHRNLICHWELHFSKLWYKKYMDAIFSHFIFDCSRNHGRSNKASNYIFWISFILCRIGVFTNSGWQSFEKSRLVKLVLSYSEYKW